MAAARCPSFKIPKPGTPSGFSSGASVRVRPYNGTRETAKNRTPARGPQWDALGVAANGAAVLVEAKAHIDELISPPSQASPASLDLIRRSLSETARFLKSVGGHDWSHTFYQYANRLAHLYLLRELNDVPAWLVFVYFLGDAEMDGPRTGAEWRAAVRVLHGALGLRASHPLSEFVLDVHVDVTELPERIT